MSMKYRKKPVVVEAFQFNQGMEFPKWFQHARLDRKVAVIDPQPCALGPGGIVFTQPMIEVKTLEGTMFANIGDFIIKGIKGEIYPCRQDIFKETYEEV